VLKRAWIVISVVWSLVWSPFANMAIQEPETSSQDTLIILAMVALPWIVGPLILWAGRFICFGSLRARN
jgi:ACR3 family arsenite efflux pump ArsB